MSDASQDMPAGTSAQDQLSATAEKIVNQLKEQSAQLAQLISEAGKSKTDIEKGKAFAFADMQAIVDTRKQVDALKETTQKTLKKFQDQKEAMELEVSSLQAAIENLKKEHETFKGLADSITLIKKEVEQDKVAASADAQTISEALLGVDKLKKQAEVSSKTLEETQLEITTEITSLKTAIGVLAQDRDALKNIVSEVGQIKAAAENGKKSTLADVQTISEAKQKFDDLRIEAEASHEDLVTHYSESEEKISEIIATYDQIVKERSELLDDQPVEGSVNRSVANTIRDTNVQLKSLLEESQKHGQQTKEAQEKLTADAKSQWDGDRADLKQQLMTLVQQSTVQIETLKKDLENEIRRLLPGAGAAGLASAYVDAKSNYGPIKFEYTGSREGWYWLKYFGAWIAYLVRSYAAPAVFYTMFVGPVGVFAWFFYDLLDFFKAHPEKFDPSLFLLRVGISIPLLTLSWFGWNSIRLHRQLFEEYNHKQRVMQLYDSFKKEIEKMGTGEQQKMLLGIMLTTVADKPSLAMHKYDKGIESLIPTFNLGNIGSILGITTKAPAEAEIPAAIHNAAGTP